MPKPVNLHEVRDFFPNRNLVEGAVIKEQEDGSTMIMHATLIEAGLSDNRNMYRSAVLQKAVPMFENIQIRTDHPKDGDNHSVKSVVGRITESWWNPTKQKIQANIKFSSTEGEILTKMREGLIGDLSINARGETSIERDAKGSVFRDVKEITKVWSVDLVTDAAAGGTVNADLHESYRRVKETCQRMVSQMDELENVTLEELKKARPDLVEQISKQVKTDKPNDSTSLPTALSRDDIKSVIQESVDSLLKDTFAKRDKKQEERETAAKLAEEIRSSVDKVLKESDAHADIKDFIGRGLLEYAKGAYESIDKIDQKDLSEKRDELLDEFSKLVEKHGEGSNSSQGSGNRDGKTSKPGKMLSYLHRM